MSEIDAATALETLHARHYVRLVRLATVLVDQQTSAEEIVQDAFLAMIGRWDRLRDLGAAEAYLRRSVVNGSRDRLRRRRVRRALPLPAVTIERSAEDHAVSNDEQRRVVAALRDLPTRQRDVLALRHLGGLSERETAETLGISQGAAKSAAHKGIATLRRKMDSGEQS
jgi:RNA polymerase sigma-70 factor (sigma-E family)